MPDAPGLSPRAAGPPRIAFIGLDRQLHVVPVQGGAAARVTWSQKVGGLAALPGTRTPDGCTWPCWSPDGRWLAAFRTEVDGVGAQGCLFVAEVGGVRERELFRQPDEHPIYARWSPDGRNLALLCQHQEELLLYTVDVASGRHRLVEHGVPLFFCWTPDGTGLLVHCGAAKGPGRLVHRVVVGPGEDAVFPVAPGSFCAPVVLPGAPPRVLFATAAPGGVSHVCTADLDGERLRHVASLRGLLALVPDPEGRRVAIGCAPGGEATPYDGIWLADLEGGPLHQISAHANMAFFWADGGRALVYAAAHRASGCVRWYRCRPGALDPSDSVEQELLPSWPTRDQVFLLHFFDQFAGSHGLLDPDGRWLLVASWPDPAASPDRGPGARTPRILRVDLSLDDPEAVVLAQGSLAIFGPPAPAG